jgi:hypothetical protein
VIPAASQCPALEVCLAVEIVALRGKVTLAAPQDRAFLGQRVVIVGGDHGQHLGRAGRRNRDCDDDERPWRGSSWLAFAATSAPNTSYLQYLCVGTGATNRT